MIEYLLPILAILIGHLATVWLSGSNRFNFKLILTFSGAFLLSTTVFELLPKMYDFFSPKKAGAFILLGIILQIVLEFFSKGAEHGHIHFSKESSTKLPWFLLLSVFVHAFLEGFPIAHHDTIVYGVFVHKIPIAALISSYLIQLKMKIKQVYLFLAIFGLMTPMGTLFSNAVMLNPFTINGMNAMVAGMFFHISTIILFESDKGHQFNLNKILMIVIAVAIAYFI